MIDAAKTVNVHHFIRTLPKGYDMEIDEEGSNISQGEKQLLTIARAVLKDPKILILDEATSSMDTRLKRYFRKPCISCGRKDQLCHCPQAVDDKKCRSDPRAERRPDRRDRHAHGTA